MNLNIKQIILTLFFPCLIIISTYTLLGVLNMNGSNLNKWDYIGMLIPPIGGALPIFLTLKHNIDTSKYIIDRFIILFVSGLICLIGINAFSNSLAIYMIIVALVLLLNIVYFFCRIRNFSKFLLVTLSNPIIYYPILFMDFITHLSEEMFSGFRM